MPFDLKIAASGVITAVRPFARIRDTATDGTSRRANVATNAGKVLTKCYAEQIAQRIVFDPATEAGTLRVWVRMHTARR